jgi:alpha-glucosidase (family GH31 glycosyl hydrolase)
VQSAGERGIRVTLTALDDDRDLPAPPALPEQELPEYRFSLRQIEGIAVRRMGQLYVTVSSDPLAVDISTRAGRSIQNVAFTDGGLSFRLDEHPVLGLGQGGPSMGEDWKHEPLAYDRRGHLYEMTPRRQGKAWGTRMPIPLLVGTSGWALYMAAPRVQVDLRDERRGLLVRQAPDESDAAAETANGQLDFFLFDAAEPEVFMHDLARVAGRPLLPPRWALGYMQGHGALEGDEQMLDTVGTFREKRIPLDAVVYTGSIAEPRGWNSEQGSSAFNPAIFDRAPAEVIADLHRNNVRVVLQMPPEPPADEADEPGQSWPRHLPLLEAGVDAFWAGDGVALDLPARVQRHRMYYEGAIEAQPDERPWSLHDSAWLGAARWGGWTRSGDTASAWRTLQAQVMAGITHSLVASPWWGSDIGGVLPGEELTAELYARWFQFGAFSPLFFAHGKTWWMRLPWGWGLDEMGPLEHAENPLPSELGNRNVEDIARRYVRLRYQLVPYNYTLAWQARATGMPPMRSLWLHYPKDATAAGTASEYLWGRDLLVAPVFTQGAAVRELYLPTGVWYDWWTQERVAGGRRVTREVDLGTMPLYARAGAIIPLDPVRQYSDQRVYSPTTLRVFRGDNGEFILYDDDGRTDDYLAGEATLTRIVWDDAESRLTVEPAAPSRRSAANRRFVIELIPTGQSRRLTYLGRRVTIDFSN